MLTIRRVLAKILVTTTVPLVLVVSWDQSIHTVNGTFLDIIEYNMACIHIPRSEIQYVLSNVLLLAESFCQPFFFLSSECPIFGTL